MAEHQFRGRREDRRLVTGQGRYTTDHHLNGQVAAHFLRADRAHARIVRIDVAEARKGKGVLDVITGADIVAAGWKTPPVLSFFKGVGGSSVRIPFRPGLAHQRVRFVGEPVAVVIAETEHLAQDAAETIEIEYEDLPVVVDAGEALKPSAPRVHEEMPDNLSFEYEYGNSAGVEQAFAKAAHVIRVGVTAQRIAGNPMEPKSCLARYDAATDTYDLYCPTQGISDIRAALASITGLDAAKFRVHSNDVGGGFGVRNEIYPEFLAVLLAAKRTGKPVRWTGTRSETISGDHHARGADLKGELAIDDKGKFLGLRVEWLVNMGAYCSGAGALINTVAAPTSSATSLYKVPAFYGRHRLVFTNTTPITAYRGAGRPNVAYLWERLVEQAAATLGVDPVPAAPAQHFAQVRVPDEDADRPHLRQRRSGASARHCAAGRGLGRLQGAPQGGEEERAASRHRARDVPRAVRRGRQGADRNPHRAGRQAGDVFQRRPDGAGVGDGAARDRVESPRHARGPDRASLQRQFGAEADGHRLVRLTLADQPRRRADERRQGNRRERQGAGGRRA